MFKQLFDELGKVDVQHADPLWLAVMLTHLRPIASARTIRRVSRAVGDMQQYSIIFSLNELKKKLPVERADLLFTMAKVKYELSTNTRFDAQLAGMKTPAIEQMYLFLVGKEIVRRGRIIRPRGIRKDEDVLLGLPSHERLVLLNIATVRHCARRPQITFEQYTRWDSIRTRMIEQCAPWQNKKEEA